MEWERCEECGFDGSEWSDTSALDAVASLPVRWRMGVTGVDDDDLQRRPRPGIWSIAEYADHMREVLFGMRFLLEVAIGQPGTDLGEAPRPRFDPEPRTVDVDATLTRIEEEVSKLVMSFTVLTRGAWASTVILDGKEVDPHWITRHAVHDATHHLLDIKRIRAAF